MVVPVFSHSLFFCSPCWGSFLLFRVVVPIFPLLVVPICFLCTVVPIFPLVISIITISANFNSVPFRGDV